MKVPEPRKLKSGTWFIQMRLGGESVPVSAATRTECIRQAEKIKADYRNGKRPKPASACVTLRSAIEQYIQVRENVKSPETIRGYYVILNNRFKAYMGRDIRQIPYQRMINEEAKTVSAKTLFNAWNLSAAAIEEAGQDRPKVSLPDRQKKEHVYLTYDQITVFVDAIRGADGEIPALLALHGLRRSEICALDWAQLRGQEITVAGALVYDKDGKKVRKKTNKNATSRRTVPIMIPRLQELVDLHADDTGPVATVAPNTIYRQVNRVCETRGLPLVGVHGLRHSFASLCYHLGVPMLITMRLGGWKTDRIPREIYTHLADADIANQVDAIRTFYSQNANENHNENTN